MPASPLTALSPLDGRYVAKVDKLRPAALRVRPDPLPRPGRGRVVHRLVRGRTSPNSSRSASRLARQLRGLVERFCEVDAEAIKAIERTTNHDVKAVEYWLAEQIAGDAELAAKASFLHFACTSEDINNTSHGLMLEAARREVLLPALDALSRRSRRRAVELAAQPMLSRTHGQTASPTTLGKEIANVAVRLAAGPRKHRRGAPPAPR